MSDDANGRYVKGAPADVDVDDDRVPGSEDLPVDIAEDDLSLDEDPDTDPLPDEDPHAPADGQPFSGEVPIA